MIRTPAHKQTDPQKAPGVTKDFDRHPYLKTSTADQTLGDYYKKKMDAAKKLTFEEWWKVSKAYYGEHLETNYRFVWQEAQKNV